MNELNCTKATRFLIENNMTISFMESCTSGLLASMLTDTEGASGIFRGSLVTYSNEMKIAAGVAAQTIERHGVYSSQCAKDMAQVCQNIYKTDIAIGITGTTGNIEFLLHLLHCSFLHCLVCHKCFLLFLKSFLVFFVSYVISISHFCFIVNSFFNFF